MHWNMYTTEEQSLLLHVSALHGCHSQAAFTGVKIVLSKWTDVCDRHKLEGRKSLTETYANPQTQLLETQPQLFTAVRTPNTSLRTSYTTVGTSNTTVRNWNLIRIPNLRQSPDISEALLFYKILVSRCHLEEMNSQPVKIPTRFSADEKILYLANVGYGLWHLLSSLIQNFTFLSSTNNFFRELWLLAFP